MGLDRQKMRQREGNIFLQIQVISGGIKVIANLCLVVTFASKEVLEEDLRVSKLPLEIDHLQYPTVKHESW